MEELHVERPDARPLAGLDGLQPGLAQQAVAAELGLEQAARQRGGVDWHRNLVEHVADGAGVVLMPMSNDDPAHPVPVLEQVAEVGDDVVDPQHVILGEHDAGVDHQGVVAVLQDHHILADLPQTTEGDQAQRLACHAYIP